MIGKFHIDFLIFVFWSIVGEKSSFYNYLSDNLTQNLKILENFHSSLNLTWTLLEKKKQLFAFFYPKINSQMGKIGNRCIL